MFSAAVQPRVRIRRAHLLLQGEASFLIHLSSKSSFLLSPSLILFAVAQLTVLSIIQCVFSDESLGRIALRNTTVRADLQSCIIYSVNTWNSCLSLLSLIVFMVSINVTFSLPPASCLCPPRCPFPSPVHYINKQGFLFSSISHSSLCSHFVHQPLFRAVPEVWLLLYSAALSGA